MSKVQSREEVVKGRGGVVWVRIKKFPGQTELSMSAEVELISTTTEKKSTTRPPIQMEFQVSN